MCGGRQLREVATRTFCAIVEAVADGRKIRREFAVYLPEGAEGVDVVRAVEALVAGRGWRQVVIGTGSNGTVLPEEPSPLPQLKIPISSRSLSKSDAVMSGPSPLSAGQCQ